MIDFPPELKDHLIKHSEDYVDLLFAMAVAQKGKKGNAKRALQKAAGISPKTAERWFDMFTRVLAEDWLRMRKEAATAVAEPPVTAAAAGNDLDFQKYKAGLRRAKGLPPLSPAPGPFDNLLRRFDEALEEGNKERQRYYFLKLRKLDPVMLRHYGLYPKTAFPRYFAKKEGRDIDG